MSSPEAAPFPQVLEITKRSAAGNQLETAIRLWFKKRDPSSIHTLAIAASGILDQMCNERTIKRSDVRGLMEAKPEAYQNMMRGAQNFFKHGRHKVRKWRTMVLFVPEYTELVLVDCLSMHVRLFGTLSPMMRLFAFRYNLFNPKAFPMQMTVKGFKVEDLRGFSRRQFVEEVLPRLRVQIGEIPPAS